MRATSAVVLRLACMPRLTVGTNAAWEECLAKLQTMPPHLPPVVLQIGDGDCGSTLAKGAAAIQQQLAALPLGDPAAAALALAALVGRSMGGTSGAVVSAVCIPCCVLALSADDSND